MVSPQQLILYAAGLSAGAFAGAVSLILAGCASSSTGALMQNDVAVHSFEAFSQDGAWALTENGLLRTTDGGRSWADVTPGELRGDPFGETRLPAVFFRDGSLAWLATFSAPVPAPETVSDPVSATIFYTTDGGAAWNSRALSLDIRAGEFSGQGKLFFYDESTGWLMAKFLSSSAFSRGVLYRTSDGGETWLQVSIPIAGPFQFTSPSDGWVAGGPAGNQLFVTHDGGVTWSEQTGPLESPDKDKPWLKTVALPTFFDELNGVLPIQIYEGEVESSAALHLYRTSDGGESWVPAGPPVELVQGVVSGGRAPGLAFVNPVTWMLIANGQLFVSDDAGGNWSAVSIDRELQSVIHMDFTTPEQGWVYTQDERCVEKQNCVTESHLLRTEDGGRTWKEEPVSAQQAVTP